MPVGHHAALFFVRDRVRGIDFPETPRGTGGAWAHVTSGAVSRPGKGLELGDRANYGELLMSSPPCALSFGPCKPSLTPNSKPFPNQESASLGKNRQNAACPPWCFRKVYAADAGGSPVERKKAIYICGTGGL